jgi:hypothetical protein
VDAGMNVTRSLHNPYDYGKKGNKLTWVMAFPLLITNMVATSFVGYKAWYAENGDFRPKLPLILSPRHHHRDIRKFLNQCGNQVSRVQKVLMLLIESGMIYCGLWVSIPFASRYFELGDERL